MTYKPDIEKKRSSKNRQRALKRKRKKQASQQKTRVSAIHLNSCDIKSINTSILPNGNKIFDFEVKAAHYEIGYMNDKGKFKIDFRSPNFMISSWLVELEFDCHYCFVDTNTVNFSYPYNSGEFVEMYVTGWYIFQIAKMEVTKTEYFSDISWEVDYINSKIGLSARPIVEGNPEINGWQIAIEELKKIDVKKAKIIVDAHRDQLNEFNSMLPHNWKFFYASSDLSATWFNRIFNRLDKAIKILTINEPQNYEKIDVERYLMGINDHLIKK